MDFGELLNSPVTVARVRKGLTQEKLAELVGVSRMTISLWENGRRTPKAETILRAAQVLEVPMEELMRKPKNWKNRG